MTWHEFLNLHPLEQVAMSKLAMSLESDRRDFQSDLVEALAKSLSG